MGMGPLVPSPTQTLYKNLGLISDVGYPFTFSNSPTTPCSIFDTIVPSLPTKSSLLVRQFYIAR